MSGYSDFSTFSARRASGFVASAEIVLDDGTSYGPYAFAGVDTFVHVFHGWRGDFENDAEWEELNGLNTDVDVFLNWSDGTRLKFRAYSCATPQSADFVEPNELTARAEPNYTQLVEGNPKHPMHATARTSITLREPDYYQAPVAPDTESTWSITHVLDGGYSYGAPNRSNKFVRGFGIDDNRALYNWIKTQPHTVLIPEDGSGKGGAMNSVSDTFGEIIRPDFDMKIQVSYTGTGSIYGPVLAEYSVHRITYGTIPQNLGQGTNLTLTQEHRFYHPSNLVFDETLDFNPTDTDNPLITLTGDAVITLTQGDTYTEQGATWTDNVDGTGDATVSGSVDTSAVGTYTISYDYTDAAGNVATTVTRTVNVGAPPAAFSVPDLIVNENTAVNHEVSPSGGDWTTTVTNLMSPLTLSGNYIVGTTQEVPGYKNVTVSVAQTATVTRTNSYGSTSAQLDILVLNTTEEPDRDGDGTPDSTDDFPDDPDEDTDTDGDGVGDNKDSHPDDPRFNDVDTNSILYAVGQAVKAAGQSGGGGDTEADSYTTNAFTNGVLSGQSKYTAQGGTLLETKTFTYTSGNLTSVVEKDGSDVITLTKTLTYDGDGNLASITKDYA